jgi:hypothetical protein
MVSKLFALYFDWETSLRHTSSELVDDIAKRFLLSYCNSLSVEYVVARSFTLSKIAPMKKIVSC